MNDNPLNSLVGEQCSSICFVLDYVEFHFNGQGLTSLTDPIVFDGSNRYQFPNEGSRDALALLAGDTVKHIEVVENLHIRLQFIGDKVLIIPLSEEYRIGPESAYYSPGPQQPISVW